MYLHVFVPRPSRWVFHSLSFVGLNPNPNSASKKPGVVSAKSHVSPGPSVPLVLQTILLGSLKPGVEFDDPDVKLAPAILMTCWSSSLKLVVFPRAVNSPPKIICPFEALVMDVTGPLKPLKGRFVQPFDPTQAIAFVEFTPIRLPPKYTVFVS